MLELNYGTVFGVWITTFTLQFWCVLSFCDCQCALFRTFTLCLLYFGVLSMTIINVWRWGSDCLDFDANSLYVLFILEVWLQAKALGVQLLWFKLFLTSECERNGWWFVFYVLCWELFYDEKRICTQADYERAASNVPVLLLNTEHFNGKELQNSRNKFLRARAQLHGESATTELLTMKVSCSLISLTEWWRCW